MPRVDESRELREIDSLYACLKKVDELNKALVTEVLELREALTASIAKNEQSCIENEALKKELLEKILAKQQLEALYSSGSRVLEPIEVSERGSPEGDNTEYLRRRVEELKDELDKYRMKVSKEEMLLDIKEHAIKDQESKIKRLEDQVRFLASTQNDSCGAASSAYFFDDEAMSGQAEQISRGHMRVSKRFLTEKIKNECQRCHKPIPTGEEFSKCMYHLRKPLLLYSWSKMGNYESYAMQPEVYSKYMLWPCCDWFNKQAGRGCMTNDHHDVDVTYEGR